MEKLSMDSFLEKARAVHGDTYDYLDVVLRGAKEKVAITCRIHGRFEQSPDLHLRGSGCPACAKEKRRETMLARYGVEYASQSAAVQEKSRETRERKFGGMKPPGSGRKAMGTDEFIRRARVVHGDYYNYSQVRYVNGSTKVRILCPVHGVFEQSPAKHLSGQGCPDRSHRTDAMRGKAAGKLAEFVEKARAVHGDKYDYSKAVWAGMKLKLEIVCPAHGPFMQSPEKHLAGCGCPHPDCVAAVRRARSLERHGTEHPSMDPAVREKAGRTSMERYGAPNVMLTEYGKARMGEACMEKFGGGSPFESPEVREKILVTDEARYGGRGPMCSSGVREKAVRTSLEKYGTDNPMKDDGVKAAQRAAVEAAYGVPNPMLDESVKQKQREAQAATMLERYGADSGFGSRELREKAAETNMRKYGAANAMQSKEVAGRMTASKIANGTASSSEPEETLYRMLAGRFGEADVVRQHASDAYPWACDFYIRSRGLYVELNGTWTHGGRWYAGSEADLAKAAVWRKDGREYYANAVRTWTVTDAAKREAARKAGLNYVVFWDDGLGDAEVWFDLGCPDGRDWEREYSWLPDRKLDGLSLSARTFSGFVRRYQFPVVYARELALWEANEPHGNWPSVRMALYANRLKYLGKGPVRLTDREILSGFTISGILRGYTTFDPSVMAFVVGKYGIRSIYDPCAGWGERMAWCAANGVAYAGMDVNAALEPGYAAMMAGLGVDGLSFRVGDSGSVVPACRADAVLTCPPYGHIEIYSPDGAENLPRADFLAWWGRVARLSTDTGARYFCFQVNRKWRDGMLAAVERAGYVLADEIACAAKSSHMTRAPGRNLKRESESMLVLERKF